MSLRDASGESPPNGREPNPPIFATSATILGVTTPSIGAKIMGYGRLERKVELIIQTNLQNKKPSI
ncbi:hypothetical protein ELAK_20940 [Elizabethkingia anophelis]|nr:hypothetical protein ELAK_20940 [Elizabethkingia anophelis]